MGKYFKFQSLQSGVNGNRPDISAEKDETLTSLQAQSRNIQACFENGYTAPVMINSFYLEHAILNVINNAIDAMP